jgi:hypothetical protein
MPTQLTRALPPTLGAAGPAILAISLNGQQWHAAPLVAVQYVGVHTPELISAAFSDAATSLLVFFDKQRTNRAGMGSAVLPCATLLDNATVTTLQGSSLVVPACYWEDESTLVAQLTALTTAAPGMAVGIQAGVLAPAADLGSASKTAEAASVTVSIDFPCVGACPVPSLALAGVSELSDCPGGTLRLDGTLVNGGGIKAPTWKWGVDASVSDFWQTTKAYLDSLPGYTPVLYLSDDQGLPYAALRTTVLA